MATLVRLFVRERGSWRLHISAHYFTLAGSIINCECASLWLKLAAQQTHAHTYTHTLGAKQMQQQQENGAATNQVTI